MQAQVSQLTYKQEFGGELGLPRRLLRRLLAMTDDNDAR